jgi:hypothetical protein
MNASPETHCLDRWRLSPQERDLLVERLTTSLAAVSELCERLTDQQWLTRPQPDAWAASECVEHLIVCEEALLGMIRSDLLQGQADPSLPQTVAGRDGHIVSALMDRSVRIKTLPSLEPAGRWRDREAAILRFNDLRAQTIDYVRTTEDALHLHGAPFGALGLLDSYQWLLAMAVHTERHIQQAAEAASHHRASIIAVVEAYIYGLGAKDLSRVPFAPDFTLEGPLVPALAGQPHLSGEEAVNFLEGLFPAIKGVTVRQHIAEGDYCASVFHLHTIHGTIPIFDRFHVAGGRLRLVNPFFDPTPVLNGMATAAGAGTDRVTSAGRT